MEATYIRWRGKLQTRGNPEMPSASSSIGKAKRPRAFNKKTGTKLGFVYRNNATLQTF
jgi:hypothetical protein